IMLGSVSERLDNANIAFAEYQTGLALAEGGEFIRGQIFGTLGLATVAMHDGRFGDAMGMCRKAIATISQDGAQLFEGEVKHKGADLLTRTGGRDQARVLYREAIVIFRRDQSNLNLANSLSDFGQLLRMECQFDDAKAVYNEALVLYRTMDNRTGQVNV